MNPKIKNIIIFVGVGVALVLVYIFFFKKPPEQTGLTITPTDSTLPTTTTTDATSQNNSAISADFLSKLLSVKSITLDDSIFSNSVFATLHDSSIDLTPDGTQGRPNPFAPIGTDVLQATNGTNGTNGTSAPDTTSVSGTTAGSGISGTVGTPITTPADTSVLGTNTAPTVSANGTTSTTNTNQTPTPTPKKSSKTSSSTKKSSTH